MNIVNLLNGVSVGIFGMVLSASFCNIVWTRQKKLILAGSMAVVFLIQGVVYFFVDPFTVRLLYPFITHVPLILVLCVLSKKYLWAAITVLTAYLCCYLRRWLALLVVAVCTGDAAMQEAVELFITLPLTLLLLRFVAPAVRSFSQYSVVAQCQFGLIPLLAYLFDYLTQIYTDLAARGAPVIVEFMSFVCSAAYLVFVLYTSEERRIRSQLEEAKDCLNLQVMQSVREIETLRRSQEKAGIYRHDLRHHMQYLSACIENGRLEQAQTYIQGICSEIEANKVKVFCENEAANLIFSAFDSRAEEYKIPLKIQADIPLNIAMAENDLCVLLSNGLENALNACKKLKEKGINGEIDVQIYEKRGKLFFQISNTCDNDIIFEHGIPVTDNLGHGLGTRSICALVEQYRGIYSFSVKNGCFILRVSL